MNVNKLKEFAQLQKAKITIGLAAAATGTGVGTAFAANSIEEMVKKALQVVEGIVVFGGIISLFQGFRSLAKGLSDDGSGPDAQAVSKGKGQILAGAVMVLPVALITMITGSTPDALVAQYFQ